MAKAAKKSAKEASNIFHSIMKASVNVNSNEKMRKAKQWILLEHPTTGRNYEIEYHYEEGDLNRKCIIILKSNNPAKEDTIISSFGYPADRQGIEVDEKAKMIAINHGDMQPKDGLI